MDIKESVLFIVISEDTINYSVLMHMHALYLFDLGAQVYNNKITYVT